MRLNALRGTIRDGETMYTYLSRHMRAARVAHALDVRAMHDARPATPRRILATLRRVTAECGYPARALRAEIIGCAFGCDGATVASVRAVTRRPQGGRDR